MCGFCEDIWNFRHLIKKHDWISKWNKITNNVEDNSSNISGKFYSIILSHFWEKVLKSETETNWWQSHGYKVIWSHATWANNYEIICKNVLELFVCWVFETQKLASWTVLVKDTMIFCVFTELFWLRSPNLWYTKYKHLIYVILVNVSTLVYN